MSKYLKYSYKHMDLPVFVLSVVSNQCYPIEDTETTIEEVLEMVQL